LLPRAKCSQVPPIRGGAAQWVMFDDDYVSAFNQARLPGDFTSHAPHAAGCNHFEM
jgi:hypothetical protein